MNDKVRIGVIGTGFARKVQIPAFLNCPDAEIVSVASASPENARQTAREFNIEHFTDNWRETVEREDIDLICITTPPNLHFEQTLYAVKHGKHILCEKPMTMNAGEARIMTEKAREKNILALIDHELRFQDGRQRAYSMLRNGEIGKIRHAKYNFRNASRGEADLLWNWWSDKSAGGGSLGAIGSHVIDSLIWFLGADVSSVLCQLQTHIKERKDAKTGELREVTSDDESTMILRFAENDLTADATGIVSVSMVEYPKYENLIEFFGTQGALRVGYLGEIFLAKSGESDWRKIETQPGKMPSDIFDSGFPSGFMSFAPKIIEAIKSGKNKIEYAADFDDGLKVQKVLDAAHKSNEEGCRVKT